MHVFLRFLRRVRALCLHPLGSLSQLCALLGREVSGERGNSAQGKSGSNGCGDQLVHASLLVW
jgi:hypothetical protein